jgi:hypothetical protein
LIFAHMEMLSRTYSLFSPDVFSSICHFPRDYFKENLKRYRVPIKE